MLLLSVIHMKNEFNLVKSDYLKDKKNNYINMKNISSLFAQNG